MIDQTRVFQMIFCRGSLEEGFEQLLRTSQNTLISLKIIDCGNILTDR